MLESRKNVAMRFLRSLCKIKGWKYQIDIETKKAKDIDQFISTYIIRNQGVNTLDGRISYSRVSHFLAHPSYISEINAVVCLMELSKNETDFHNRYQRVNYTLISDGSCCKSEN